MMSLQRVLCTIPSDVTVTYELVVFFGEAIYHINLEYLLNSVGFVAVYLFLGGK